MTLGLINMVPGSKHLEKNKGYIKSLDLYGWFKQYFRYLLGRKSYDDERQIARWKGIVSRFKNKLVKMIRMEQNRTTFFLL